MSGLDVKIVLYLRLTDTKQVSAIWNLQHKTGLFAVLRQYTKTKGAVSKTVLKIRYNSSDEDEVKQRLTEILI